MVPPCRPMDVPVRTCGAPMRVRVRMLPGRTRSRTKTVPCMSLGALRLRLGRPQDDGAHVA